MVLVTSFGSEVIYQNLVRTVDPHAPESVHHCDYPQADMPLVADSLLTQMTLTRQVCSLGLSARSSANLKVRQPLAKVFVHLGTGKAELAAKNVELILDELNVKAFEFVSEAEQLVEYRILPNNRLLGPKFGKQFPAVRRALAEAEATEIVAKIDAGEAVTLLVDGETIALMPDEIVVMTQPAEGLAVAADKVVTVAIDTLLTEDLATEGLAREIVRRVQNIRKEADFNIEDRIILTYQAAGRLVQVFNNWEAYIKAETLAQEIVQGVMPEKAYVKTEQMEGETIMLGVERIG